MKLTKIVLILVLLLMSVSIYAKGGDDAGNGGFAFKQSIKILEMATSELEEKIRISTLAELEKYPERREILKFALKYENLKKWYLWVRYRDGRQLAMDYSVKNKTVTILKPYYQAFAGRADNELEAASLEVQKRLLHEASHLWGYNEGQSELFAVAFLNNIDDNQTRPTNAITIQSNFCSCINGKSDIINNCDSFCATKPKTDQPILYAVTKMGAEILVNPNLGNLYNWCTVQLSNDTTTPQCHLNATDGDTSINIPINLTKGSNSFSANIISLAKNRTWLLKLVEFKTESNAESREFQLRRVHQPDSNPDLGSLKVTPISQYSCLHYDGKLDSNGNIVLTSEVKQYYYMPVSETPAPMSSSMVVCHDKQMYPGPDSIVYPRLELIPSHMAMFDKIDSRFILDIQSGKMRMNKILEDRLQSEYNIISSVSIFSLLRFPNRPSASEGYAPLGYMLNPFLDQRTGRAYCPVEEDFKGNTPLMNLLGEYIEDTEGLYLAEKGPVEIVDGNTYKNAYGVMFIKESMLVENGFYINNGLKTKADKDSLHSKTIHYYWPVNKNADPLTQNGRTIFTVRAPSEINGNKPSIDDSINTSDKRIGCIPIDRK